MYLTIHSATGNFKKTIQTKYEVVWSGIKSKIKTLNGGKELNFFFFFDEKNYAGIAINTDDDLPLKKQLKFPTLAIIIRCVLQKDEKLYTQIYLI